MAMTMQVQGIEELSKKLNALGDKAEEVASRALYAGAGVMADQYTAAANSIRTQPTTHTEDGHKRLATPAEKAAVIGKTGIARFNRNGTEVDTKVGVGARGYVEINGKRKAAAKIANAINSGTSFMTKQPVFHRAATQGAGPASAAIVEAADRLIEEITK